MNTAARTSQHAGYLICRVWPHTRLSACRWVRDGAGYAAYRLSNFAEVLARVESRVACAASSPKPSPAEVKA